jgi:cytochrome P450
MRIIHLMDVVRATSLTDMSTPPGTSPATPSGAPSGTPPVSDVDLFADDVLVDPYPVYTELRERGPVVRLPRNDVYALTRYDVIRAALADWESFSSTSIAFNPMANQALTGTSLASDPPVHTRLRATLTENLSPRALRGLKGRIEAKADALVADLVEKGSFEAVDALARAFPLEVVADLIGFTGHVRDNMLRWGQAAMQVLGPMNHRTAESFPIAGELYAWCSEVRAADLAEGSVGRGIFDAEARGAVPPGTAGHIIHQYLGAGVDTTIAAIGNIVALFAAHPDQLHLVRRDPSLVPAAFNEALRYWAPVHAWGRRVTRDVEIEGTVIPAGAQVAVLFGAGNHDPGHYEDPDTFLVPRNPVDHLSFGYGPHGCAGQGLARMEAHAVIGALSRRVERLVVGPEVRVPSNTTRSIEELPVLEVIPA